MKKVLMLAGIILMTSVTLLAESDPVATKVRALNLSEVVENIQYPIDSRSEGVEGRVVVLLKISETGKVLTNRIVSADCPKLAAAVESAIEDVKFSPALDSEGNAITSTVKLPIDFELELD